MMSIIAAVLAAVTPLYVEHNNVHGATPTMTNIQAWASSSFLPKLQIFPYGEYTVLTGVLSSVGGKHYTMSMTGSGFFFSDQNPDSPPFTFSDSYPGGSGAMSNFYPDGSPVATSNIVESVLDRRGFATETVAQSKADAAESAAKKYADDNFVNAVNGTATGLTISGNTILPAGGKIVATSATRKQVYDDVYYGFHGWGFSPVLHTRKDYPILFVRSSGSSAGDPTSFLYPDGSIVVTSNVLERVVGVRTSEVYRASKKYTDDSVVAAIGMTPEMVTNTADVVSKRNIPFRLQTVTSSTSQLEDHVFYSYNVTGPLTIDFMPVQASNSTVRRSVSVYFTCALDTPPSVTWRRSGHTWLLSEQMEGETVAPVKGDKIIYFDEIAPNKWMVQPVKLNVIQ